MTLSTHNLSIGYNRRVIADGIYFHLPPAHCACLLGANGAGKSTLFKTLLRLIPPLGGQVLLDGADIAAVTPACLATRLAYVPQVHQSLPDFSVSDMVLMGRAARIGLFGQPSKNDRDRAAVMLEKLNIGRLKNRRFRQLSGGEQQLVLIARSLVQEPEFLIMDEPTASLDFGNQILVMESIAALKNQGYGILFSTHHPEQVKHITDSLWVLQNSALSHHLPDDFLTAEHLAGLYGLPAAQIRKYLKL